jgi:putative transposase
LKIQRAYKTELKLNVLKRSELSWMYEASKCAPQEALRDLDRAFEHFFRRVGSGRKPGFPRFKSRRRGPGSFRLTGSIRVEERRIKLPRLGRLRLKERGYLPRDAKILSATVSERAGRWFVSVLVEEDVVRPYPPAAVCGVDVGIEKLAVVSDGTVFENPRALKKAEKKLRLLSKAVSRKKKGSRNRRNAVARLRRQHYRIACMRKDCIHKATTTITKRFGHIAIESLNVQGMIRNHCLSKALSDGSLSEFLRQVRYKSNLRGCRITEAPRFYPSSKMCSRCGTIKDDLGLGERLFHCERCSLEMDRDLNAAINLKNVAVSSTVTACREDVRPVYPAASLKQEADARNPSPGIFGYIP